MIRPRKQIPELKAPLSSLNCGEGGWVDQLDGPQELVIRFMEMGLLEEEYVEVLHEAPFGRDPLAVRVRGTTLAIRREQARHISIRRVPQL